MRDNPELADKPIAVGGSPERRGVVATCDYAARKFGIHSAMSSAIARKRCADLIIVRPDMEKYRSASSKIHRIFERYTSLIEPLSLDEAYLDVTECSKFGGDASAIHLKFNGSAGQSFAAFTPPGMTFELEGDANDYIGKGLSGSKLIVYPPKGSLFKAEENILVGNVAFYGATTGSAYINGIGGERFCVRNSGVKTVIEGVGDHGCEYMTGGQVIVLGKTGRNFAAGMSGGVAYIYDIDGQFEKRLNKSMVNLYPLIECSGEDMATVKGEIEKHVQYTNSDRGKHILDNWDSEKSKFLKVFPRDYERMLECFRKVEEQGLSGDDAAMAAFEENLKDLSRVGGN